MKKERQKALIEIVTKNNITTQEELTARLTAAGFVTTQATISRDMKALGIDKVNSVYEHIGIIPDINSKFIKILTECIVSCDNAGNLVVVKTMSGMGAAAGAAIDALGFEMLVGSIAGDDTVLLVMRTQESASSVCSQLNEYHNK
ncbi:MAG TPA: arginine repressor [Bacillota bacterium]|nr:arginine repressor [Bacillota bacterium]